MKIDVRSKGIKVTEDIKKYLSQKLSKLDRFTSRELEAKVMLKVDGKLAKAEITIPLSHIIIRSEFQDQELNNAIDKCADRLESQIKSNKHKLVRSLQEKCGVNDLFIETPEVESMVTSAVKIKQYKLEVLSFDEAVTQLELLGHAFFLYRNEKGLTCCVYKRHDGEYGLIETY